MCGVVMFAFGMKKEGTSGQKKCICAVCRDASMKKEGQGKDHGRHLEQGIKLHHKVVSLIKTKIPLTMDIKRRDIKCVSCLLCNVKKQKHKQHS